jgi:uncharacterized protein YeaO (DUF488 family)
MTIFRKIIVPLRLTLGACASDLFIGLRYNNDEIKLSTGGIMIRIKRVYDPVSPDDGHRFLVDRLWPRGIKKEKLALNAWLKEVAPSDTLRRWYAHDPAKWDEFCRRYFTELDGVPEFWQIILDTANKDHVTLLFSSKEIKRNNAAALKRYLEKHR